MAMDLETYAKRLYQRVEIIDQNVRDKLGRLERYLSSYLIWFNKSHVMFQRAFGDAAVDAMRLSHVKNMGSADEMIEALDEFDEDRSGPAAYFLMQRAYDVMPTSSYIIMNVKYVKNVINRIAAMSTADFLAVQESLDRNGFSTFARKLTLERRKKNEVEDPYQTIEKDAFRLASEDIGAFVRTVRSNRKRHPEIDSNFANSLSGTALVKISCYALLHVIDAAGLGSFDVLDDMSVSKFILMEDCLKDIALVAIRLEISRYIDQGTLPEALDGNELVILDAKDVPGSAARLLVPEISDLPSLKKFLEVLEVLKEG